MATTAQIAANRQNALKSTGPRTTEGKARSSRNRVVHGLCSRKITLTPDERALRNLLYASWVDRFQPANPAEFDLVDAGILALILRNRAARFRVEPTTTPPEAFANESGARDVTPATRRRYFRRWDLACERCLRQLARLGQFNRDRPPHAPPVYFGRGALRLIPALLGELRRSAAGADPE